MSSRSEMYDLEERNLVPLFQAGPLKANVEAHVFGAGCSGKSLFDGAPLIRTAKPAPDAPGSVPEVVHRLIRADSPERSLSPHIGPRPPVLIGRAHERESLDGLLATARRGQSAILVVRGVAGSGRSALLHYCARQASGFRVSRFGGIQAEMELPFAAVHQLCAPMLGRLDALPDPQQSALRVALGLSSGGAPDRFLVALAVLSLFSAVAEERPLLCLIDDAQWLDVASGETLGFVARRLQAESVAMVFSVREPARARWLDGLPGLSLGGLDDQDAHALLARAVPGRLNERIRDRIVAETGGNPLALLELPRSMSAAELAGGFDLPRTRGLPDHTEDYYLRRVHDLPEGTQWLLLLVSAEPAGEAATVWAAAHRLGIRCGALAPAIDAGLIEEIGEQMRFCHPDARSTLYRSASYSARQQAHQALAEVTDPQRDADGRAWHRALAATGLDEDVAAELERSAGCAQMRGGLAAAAAFLERSAELTPDAERRARRALVAAEAKLQCGEADAAQRLLAQAEAGPLDKCQRAHVRLLHGRTAFGSGHAAPQLLLGAARDLECHDPISARDAYLAALSAALFVGRLGPDVGLLDVAEAALGAPAVPTSSARPQDLLLDGLATVISNGYVSGAPLLKQAVTAFRSTGLPPGEAMRWLWPATHAASDLWDDRSWADLSARHLRLVREAGALYMLPIALHAQIGVRLFAGDLVAAASLVDEVTALADVSACGVPPYGAIALAAFRGQKAEADALIQTASSVLVRRGEGVGLTLIEYAKAVMYNGLGHYREACQAAELGAAHPHELALSTWSLPQLIEAAVRSDQHLLAEDALKRLTRTTGPSGTAWARGVEACCRALVATGPDAENCYREAIAQLRRTVVRSELARTHLLYGEWLRRERRRVQAREHLRTAHDMFAEMGMAAFAERARREHMATGESIRKRQAEAHAELTPQEAQIAALARTGLTNSEIGGQLYLSPRTVEWHLKKVFTKLGITSRRDLRDAPLGREREPTIA